MLLLMNYIFYRLLRVFSSCGGLQETSDGENVVIPSSKLSKDIHVHNMVIQVYMASAEVIINLMICQGKYYYCYHYFASSFHHVNFITFFLVGSWLKH